MVNEEENYQKLLNEIYGVSAKIPKLLMPLFENKNATVAYIALCRSLVLLGKRIKYPHDLQLKTFEMWLSKVYDENS
jgi:hypothetical protein